MSETAVEPTFTHAVSEQGKKLRHTDAEVDLALKLLAINGGKTIVTEEQLLSQNIQVHRNTLANWREHCFPRRYAQIRHELGREITEEVAGRALETALIADEAEKRYIEEALAKLHEVDPNHLAKNAAQLANTKATNIQVAQLLRDRPTEITEHRGLEELVGTLARIAPGVVEVEDAIEAEVVEEE
jgi:hypothetical protein